MSNIKAVIEEIRKELLLLTGKDNDYVIKLVPTPSQLHALIDYIERLCIEAKRKSLESLKETIRLDPYCVEFGDIIKILDKELESLKEVKEETK